MPLLPQVCFSCLSVNLGRTPLKINAILGMLRVSFSPLHPKGHRAFQEEGLPECKHRDVKLCGSLGIDEPQGSEIEEMKTETEGGRGFWKGLECHTEELVLFCSKRGLT